MSRLANIREKFKRFVSLLPDAKNLLEVTIHTLPHLKCIRLVFVRLSLPSINIGVRIELVIIIYLFLHKKTFFAMLSGSIVRENFSTLRPSLTSSLTLAVRKSSEANIWVFKSSYVLSETHICPFSMCSPKVRVSSKDPSTVPLFSYGGFKPLATILSFPLKVLWLYPAVTRPCQDNAASDLRRLWQLAEPPHRGLHYRNSPPALPRLIRPNALFLDNRPSRLSRCKIYRTRQTFTQSVAAVTPLKHNFCGTVFDSRTRKSYF